MNITEEQIEEWAEEFTQEGPKYPEHQAFIAGFYKALEILQENRPDA